MSTIKQDRKDLEMLLDGVAPISQPAAPAGAPVPYAQQGAAVVDNTNGTNLTGEKVFDFDYDATKKMLRKKARKTILGIAKHILTDEQVEEDYVQDKIEQDIETMTDLYMKLERNNVMQRSVMDTVSRGNTMPRMYEVYNQMEATGQAINKQILSTEQQIRKTYIDLKLEIKDKESELRDSTAHQSLPSPEAPQEGNQHLLVTSSRQITEILRDRHKQKMKELEEAKETQYKEE